MTESLGRLARVEVREVWKHEAHDFTPWLLEHADVLGDALGLEIELENAEHPVGGFSLDLIGRDLGTGARIIVENQLEGTDHVHLGQVVTYAAGTDAAVVVWVATEFREEHRQAIDWLNEHTDDGIQLFGVQLGVVRIGDSPRAPLLEVVAQPNDWQRTVRSELARSEISERGQMYQKFWAAYLQEARTRHPEWPGIITRQPQPANWMGFSGPMRGTRMNPSFADSGRLRHELYIDARDHDLNRAVLGRFLDQRGTLESAYGAALAFEDLDARACRIAEYTDGSIDEVARHADFIEWFIDAGERLRRALAEIDLPTDLVT